MLRERGGVGGVRGRSQADEKLPKSKNERSHFTRKANVSTACGCFHLMNR